jgi:hypothetical protein
MYLSIMLSEFFRDTAYPCRSIFDRPFTNSYGLYSAIHLPGGGTRNRSAPLLLVK